MLLGVIVHKRGIHIVKVFSGTAIFTSIVLIMGMVIYASGTSEQFTRLANRVSTFQNITTDKSIISRSEQLKEAMPSIKENLIIGVGPSKYYYDPKTEEYRQGATYDECHTHILRMMGLLGYTLFVWIFVW